VLLAYNLDKAFRFVLGRILRRLEIQTYNEFLWGVAWDVQYESKRTAKEIERSAALEVRKIPERAPDLWLWLTQNSVNSSVREIIIRSVGACTADFLSKTYEDIPIVPARWCEQMEELVNAPISTPEQLELLRRLSCTMISNSREGFLTSLSSKFCGADVVLPSFESALHMLYHLGTRYFGTKTYLPRSIDVSISDKTIKLFEFPHGEEQSQHYLLNMIKFYDLESPPRLPHHIWSCLNKREYLPKFEDQDRGVWAHVVEEVQANRKKYLEFLQYPESHQLPITLAQFFAPALAKKGWLGCLDDPNDDDIERNELKRWYPDDTPLTRRRTWAERRNHWLQWMRNALIRIHRLQPLDEPMSTATDSALSLRSPGLLPSVDASAIFHASQARGNSHGPSAHCDTTNPVRVGDGSASESNISLYEFFTMVEGPKLPDAPDAMERGIMVTQENDSTISPP
jgi:hypothetical protein